MKFSQLKNNQLLLKHPKPILYETSNSPTHSQTQESSNSPANTTASDPGSPVTPAHNHAPQ
jgi:hypothetical protein